MSQLPCTISALQRATARHRDHCVDPPDTEQTKINPPTWRHLSLAVRSFARSEVRGKACLLAVGLVTLMLAINGLNVVNSYVGRDFISAIEMKNKSLFLTKAWLYFGVFMASTVAAVFFRFVEERFGLLWREWLTRTLVIQWLNNRSYLRLHQTGAVANPDQNIAEDVKTFTTTTLSFFLMILNGVFTFIAFSGVLWQISSKLFLVAVAYASVGTLITVFLGRTLIALNYRQFDREADFRDDLVVVRENADSIAILEQEESIRDGLLQRLTALVLNSRRMISVNRNLSFFTTGYNYLIQLIPALVVAPLFIEGETDFGIITQSAMAFAQLMGAFSLIVTQFQSISTYSAVISRLGNLYDAMVASAKNDDRMIQGCESCDMIGFEHLTLRNADGTETLVQDLTVSFPVGKHVLVHGPNEPAKHALFRAVAGLWDHGEGKVIRPPDHDIAFLTERPYQHGGSTLRQTLVPVKLLNVIHDDEINDALKTLGLDGEVTKLGGLDTKHDWDSRLSLAQQQMFAAVRLLLSREQFAVMEHIDTTLNDEEVSTIIQALQARGITCITFDRGGGGEHLYDLLLNLRTDGTWTFGDAASMTRAGLSD